MQESYYIFNKDGEVIAIFQEEAYAIDYLYHLGLERDSCRIGILGESVFDFNQHDAKYHLKQNHINSYMHKDCKKFRFIDKYEGYCFFIDENVKPYERCCNAIDKR